MLLTIIKRSLMYPTTWVVCLSWIYFWWGVKICM